MLKRHFKQTLSAALCQMKSIANNEKKAKTIIFYQLIKSRGEKNYRSPENDRLIHVRVQTIRKNKNT